MASKEGEKKFYQHPLFIVAMAMIAISAATGVSQTALEGGVSIYVDPFKTRLTCAAGLGDTRKLYGSQPGYIREIAGPNMNKASANENIGLNLGNLGFYQFCSLGKDIPGAPTLGGGIALSR